VGVEEGVVAGEGGKMRHYYIILFIIILIVILLLLTNSRSWKVRRYSSIIRREGPSVGARIDAAADSLEAHRIHADFQVKANRDAGIISGERAAELYRHVNIKYKRMKNDNVP
jgi:hypothetical protein